MKDHENRGAKLNQDDLVRYASHLALPEIGIEGQQKLKGSSVICIGLGGLGSPVLLYLAAAGVGRLGLVDSDLVEDSNLQRQVIHSSSMVGKAKTDSAQKRILEINPNCIVTSYSQWLTKDNALEILEPFDIVCDCTDNFPSRYLINDACVILGKPNIYGSIAKFEGQVSVFNLNQNSPNYRDLIPQAPPEELVPSCATGGVIGVLPGIIGVIQATEIIKIITGAGESLDGRLLVFNALKMSFRELSLKQNSNQKKITSLDNNFEYKIHKNCSNFCEDSLKIASISSKELRALIEAGVEDILLLDVRTKQEHILHSILGSKSIPLASIERGETIDQLKSMISGKRLFVYCKSGKRSLKALVSLRKYGIDGVNLTGGIDAWNL